MKRTTKIIKFPNLIRCLASCSSNVYKQSATNLLNLSEVDVKKWLNSFDSVLTDCDGVLWNIYGAIEGSADTINRFKKLNKKVFFVTNNSTKTRRELMEKALQLGFKITLDGIITTSHSAAAYLKDRNYNGKVYVIGTKGITQELDAVGITHNEVGPDILCTSVLQFITKDFKREAEVGAVIVGFDQHISFPKLAKASSYVANPKCIFLVTNTDEQLPIPNYVVPGPGCIICAVETCVGRKATLIGKPNRNICDFLIHNGTIVPERTLMIGDRCNTDILLGTNCGFQTLLVGTGIHSMNHVKAWMTNGTEWEKELIPDFYVPRLGDLLDFM